MIETICTYLFGSEPTIRMSLANQFGKKGTESDISLYSYAKEYILETVDPKSYPEKILPLYQTAMMTDVPIILVPPTGPDAYTGEFALLLHALEYRNGIIVIPHEGDFYTLEEVKTKIKKMFKDLIVNNYPIVAVNLTDGTSVNNLKNLILEKNKDKPDLYLLKNGKARVDIDHVFPVKGVGTVVLGRLRNGQIKKGEKLFVHPSDRMCVLRSIQMHDIDHKTAAKNDRVGLALRGVLPKDVERGHILSNTENWEIADKVTVNLKLVPYAKRPKEGTSRHLIAGLQSRTVKILQSEEIPNKKDEYKLKLQIHREMLISETETFILIDLNDKPTIIGKCRKIR